MKYLIDKVVFKKLLSDMNEYLRQDDFGDYSIYNIYYDNDFDSVIRSCIDKPIFREKLRVRCYEQNGKQSEHFIELKKKYNGINYKRRIPYSQIGLGCQISQEIQNFIDKTGSYQKIAIGYLRKAYKTVDETPLRITFDFDIKYRYENLGLCADKKDKYFDRNLYVLEIKTEVPLPLWLRTILNSYNLVSRPFSKYGMIYQASNTEDKKNA